MYEDMINHVLLPRFLPQQRSPELHEHEISLLKEMVQTIETMEDSLPPSTVRLFQSMQKVHVMCTATDVCDEIKKLTPGETFAMFIRRQNTAFMVHMPESGRAKSKNSKAKPDKSTTVIVSTFPGNIHPNEIYTHPSDLEVSKIQCFLASK